MELVDILKVLSDGEFHSGQELGQALGVSRTAVWKHLNKLEELGLELTSVKGRGYCIEGGLDLLDADTISETVSKAVAELIADLKIFQSIDSTSAYLLEHGECGDVCLAERQLNGRGRRGRQWQSPFAKNIYFSCAWRYDGGASALEGLSLAVGVAVVEAISSLSCPGLSLKWPNDIYYQGKKLGGILLEMSGDVSGDCKVIVGVGVNVDMPVAAAAQIDQAYTDLRSAGFTKTRNQLVAALLEKLYPVLASYDKKGFAAYKAQWEALDAFRGREVNIISASQTITGIADGVADSGAIRLRIDGAVEEFSGGELSLRLKQ